MNLDPQDALPILTSLLITSKLRKHLNKPAVPVVEATAEENANAILPDGTLYVCGEKGKKRSVFCRACKQKVIVDSLIKPDRCPCCHSPQIVVLVVLEETPVECKATGKKHHHRH
jgi:hypothetical protein